MSSLLSCVLRLHRFVKAGSAAAALGANPGAHDRPLTHGGGSSGGWRIANDRDGPDGAAQFELELAAEDLRAAAAALGRVTGAIGTEAVLDSLFSEFCIGK